jgi:predicted ATP-dependent endonuclease of OLD family
MSMVLDPSCLVLLGVNETGKSNILRALSLLNPNVAISPDDVRQIGSAEDPPRESSVEFFFPLSDEEKSELAVASYQRVLGPTSALIARVNGTELNFGGSSDESVGANS